MMIVELPNGLIGLAGSSSLPVEISRMNEEDSQQFEAKLRLRELKIQEEQQRKSEEQRQKGLDAQEKKHEEERRIQPELVDL